MCPQSDETNNAVFWVTLEKGKRIPVRTYGSGERLMIALHGYGYEGSMFQEWEADLGGDFTICAPDLSFHGASEWTGFAFLPKEIVAMVSGITEQQQKEHFTLVGHSLGARLIVCMNTVDMKGIDQMVLLAPAGIGSFDRVPPLWMQRIMEYALAWPAWLKFFVDLGSRLGIVSNFRRRYAEVQLYPPDKRHLLFRTYNSLIHFRTGGSNTRKKWQEMLVPTLVVLAKNDRLVPNTKIRSYFQGNPSIQITETAGGHDLVTEAVARIIKSKCL